MHVYFILKKPFSKYILFFKHFLNLLSFSNNKCHTKICNTLQLLLEVCSISMLQKACNCDYKSLIIQIKIVLSVKGSYHLLLCHFSVYSGIFVNFQVNVLFFPGNSRKCNANIDTLLRANRMYQEQNKFFRLYY